MPTCSHRPLFRGAKSPNEAVFDGLSHLRGVCRRIRCLRSLPERTRFPPRIGSVSGNVVPEGGDWMARESGKMEISHDVGECEFYETNPKSRFVLLKIRHKIVGNGHETGTQFRRKAKSKLVSAKTSLGCHWSYSTGVFSTSQSLVGCPCLASWRPCFVGSAVSRRTFWLRLHARSHALRGNAVFDAPRRLASAEKRTQSVQDGIPTQSVGTRFSHGSGWISKIFSGSVRTFRILTANRRGPHCEL